MIVDGPQWMQTLYVDNLVIPMQVNTTHFMECFSLLPVLDKMIFFVMANHHELNYIVVASGRVVTTILQMPLPDLMHTMDKALVPYFLPMLDALDLNQD